MTTLTNYRIELDLHTLKRLISDLEELQARRQNARVGAEAAGNHSHVHRLSELMALTAGDLDDLKALL